MQLLMVCRTCERSCYTSDTLASLLLSRRCACTHGAASWKDSNGPSAAIALPLFRTPEAPQK
eukprot:4373385-Amphidinium_carterae.1